MRDTAGLGDARGVLRLLPPPRPRVSPATGGFRRSEDKDEDDALGLGVGLGWTASRTVRTSVFTLNLDFWLNILIFFL